MGGRWYTVKSSSDMMSSWTGPWSHWEYIACYVMPKLESHVLSLCPYHHQLSPRTNLIVSQLHVLSLIRLEEVWISSTVDDHGQN